MSKEITVASYYNQGSSFLVSSLYENFKNIKVNKTHNSYNQIESDLIALVYSDPRDSCYRVGNIKVLTEDDIIDHFNQWITYNGEFSNCVRVNFYDLVFNYDTVLQRLSEELNVPLKNDSVFDGPLKYKRDTYYLRWIGIHKFIWKEEFRKLFYEENEKPLIEFGFDYEGCSLCQYTKQGFPKVGKYVE